MNQMSQKSRTDQVWDIVRHIHNVLDDDWHFLVGSLYNSFGNASWAQEDVWLQGETTIIDSSSGAERVMQTRRWLVEPTHTEEDIVRTALLCMIQAAEHEVREGFTYKGEHIFNPHRPVVTEPLKPSGGPSFYERRQDADEADRIQQAGQSEEMMPYPQQPWEGQDGGG